MYKNGSEGCHEGKRTTNARWVRALFAVVRARVGSREMDQSNSTRKRAKSGRMHVHVAYRNGTSRVQHWEVHALEVGACKIRDDQCNGGRLSQLQMIVAFL